MSAPAGILAAALAAVALALPASASARAKTSYYVALGDSYAQGVQPIGADQADVPTKHGFNDVAYRSLRKSHPGLRLVKLGCGGATTDSLINGDKPCNEQLPYTSTSRATSQLTYSGKWIRAHRGQVAYVTVSIGGNDFAHCAGAPNFDAFTACTSQAVAQIKTNLPVIAKTLRRAAGKKAVIVGSTYPDIVLGAYVQSGRGKQLAQASVSMFKTGINPALRSGYASQKVRFADTTTAFGSYIPFEQTTTLAPFGQIPVAVANICKLGWYCTARPSGPDGHLKSAGYAKFARVVLKQLRR